MSCESVTRNDPGARIENSGDMTESQRNRAAFQTPPPTVASGLAVADQAESHPPTNTAVSRLASIRPVSNAAITANSGGTMLYQGASVTGRATDAAQAAAETPMRIARARRALARFGRPPVGVFIGSLPELRSMSAMQTTGFPTRLSTASRPLFRFDSDLAMLEHGAAFLLAAALVAAVVIRAAT